jgi:hypothetical protein
LVLIAHDSFSNEKKHLKLNKNSKKGLIIDFALEDARKVKERINKLKRIKERNKEKNQEEDNNHREDVKEEVKVKDKKKSLFKDDITNTENKEEINIETNENSEIKKNNKPKPENSILEINDISKLKELYSNTHSRG